MQILNGLTAVITGSGRGIGRAVAQAFANEGAAVAVTARSNPEIDETAALIQSTGGRAVAISADLTRQDEVDLLFEQVHGELGHVDVLVNNAAAEGVLGLPWETDPAGWLETFDINVVSMVRCCKAVIPGMIARGRGKIICVGSVAGRDPSQVRILNKSVAYGVSKAAVIHFSAMLAEVVKPYGINVNCLGVGAHTRLLDTHIATLGAEQRRFPLRQSAETPEEARIRPEENVPAFVWLASAHADHISGQYFEANSFPDIIRRNR